MADEAVLFDVLDHVATILTMPQAMRLGSTLRWVVGQTTDAKEGPRAFAEQRAPQFRGE